MLRTLLCSALVAGTGLTVLGAHRAPSSAEVVSLPAPHVDLPTVPGATLDTAVLSGGCFWGMESVFEHVRGVTDVTSGYSGGPADKAEYEIVSQGNTGHAESVRIIYDPSKVSYGDLLRVFFSVAHDPTQLNRQGPDVGTQYRSAIFYNSDAQRRVATSYIAQLEHDHFFKKPIVTQVNKLIAFYPAEAYHQDYADKHPDNRYIVINDAPKVEHLKTLLPSLYTERPAQE